MAEEDGGGTWWRPAAAAEVPGGRSVAEPAALGLRLRALQRLRQTTREFCSVLICK